MRSNKKAREKLIQLYGNECFIEKLHLRKDNNRKYTSKGQLKKMKQLTYHHIVERKNGGKPTVKNGALLSEENHIWFNQQPKEKQKEMNQKFQEYKKQVDECRVVFTDEIDISFEIHIKELVIPEKGKYDRAKKKAQDRKLINNFYEGKEEDER